MEDTQKFEVELETGELCEAELLSVVEIDGKEYAVYAIENNNRKFDILASYVVKDAEGFDELVDIHNPTDKEKISNFVKSLVKY